MKKHLEGAAIFIVVLAAALGFVLLIATLSGCGSISKNKATHIRDSVIVVKYDSSYNRRDSAGHTYTKEIYREFYRDTGTTVYQPYPVLSKEIIREAGQIVYVSGDSGDVNKSDSSHAKAIDTSNQSSFKSWGWFECTVLGVLAFLLLSKFSTFFKISLK